MIKMLPPETKMYILVMYNKICTEGKIPNGQKSAIITPLLKEGEAQMIVEATNQ